MLFCQLLFQERSAKQSTGRYVFAHCSFLGSNSSPTGKFGSCGYQSINPVLCRYITFRVFSDVLGVEFPNLIFFVLLGISWDDSAYPQSFMAIYVIYIMIYYIVVSWASRPAVHCPDFSANQATAGHECLLQLHPTFSKICGMPRLCSCRHVDIMDMPEKF